MGVNPNLFEPVFEDVFESFFMPRDIGFEVPIPFGNSGLNTLWMRCVKTRQLMDMIFVIKVLSDLDVFI